MSTLAVFNAMLNEHITEDLLKEEMIKRDYFLKNVDQDNTWLGGTLPIPFRGAQASTVKLGGLASSSEINQSKYTRGQITEQPEAWGSLLFYSKDIMRHGKVDKQNFLKLLPDELDALMDYFKGIVSLAWTNGHILDTAASNGAVTGEITVLRIERFELGMPVQLEDNTTAAAKYWVGSVNKNTNEIKLYTDMALTAAADISAYTTADNARFYVDGAQTAGNRFSSLKSLLLSAANGGSANIYGVSKLASPYTQALNISGSTISASNILDKIFDAQTSVRQKGKGMPDKVFVSYKHFGSILKLLEQSKGAYRGADSMKAELYGWSEVEIIGVKGKLTVVALPEMDNDVIFILDLRALKVYSNGFFRKQVNPDGNSFYTERATDGYKYIVDICFFGDLALIRPERCGIIHSIPNY